MIPLGPVALVVNPVAVRTTSRLRAEALRALAPHGLEWTLVTRVRGTPGGSRRGPRPRAPAWW